VNGLKDALKSEDGERIKKAIEAVNEVAYKLGEAIYKDVGARPEGAPAPGAGRAAASTAGTGGDGKGKKDDDVIDAEYEVKE
jgi:molecular chaperone DnaK